MGKQSLDELPSELKSYFREDLKMPYEFLGLQALLLPFPQYVSAQRIMMFCSNIAQALVVDGAEPPLCYTGYEGILGRYEFDDTVRDQDVLILAVIPKFRPLFGDIMVNPTLTVIYQGQNDGKIGYFDVTTYRMLHDGFGYSNKMMHLEELTKSNYIPKDMKFTTSPNHDGNLYSQGINAYTAFLGEWSVTEDAFLISDEFAEKNTHDAIGSMKFTLSEDDIPLSLYGDNGSKPFPDVGESVNDDCVLMATRKRNKTTFVSDMMEEALKTVQYLHDSPYMVPPGSKVLDVNVYINFDAYKRIKDKPGPYAQFVKYKEQHDAYYQAILAIYDKVQQDGFELTPAFNTLVTRCIGLLAPRNRVRQKLQLIDKKEPVEFISCEITYQWKRKVSRGNKFTGRDGAKGVVSAIWPKKYMPRNADGTIADICITTASPINRMNPGQFHEQYINGLSDCVVRNMQKMATVEARYQYLMEYIGDLRPLARKEIEMSIKDECDKEDLVEEVINTNKIYVRWGFIENLTYEKILWLAEKYGLQTSPLTYTAVEQDGSLTTVTTLSKTLLARKYLYLLGKLPSTMIHCVEISYVNQMETPIKPTSKYIRLQSSIGQTCQRFGEDEICMETMSMGADTIMRQMSLYGNSPKAVNLMGDLLINHPHPSQIAHIPITTNECVDTNRCITTFRHMGGGMGIDTRPTEEEFIEKKEMVK